VPEEVFRGTVRRSSTTICGFLEYNKYFLEISFQNEKLSFQNTRSETQDTLLPDEFFLKLKIKLLEYIF